MVILDLLRGQDWQPLAVGIARGLLEAAVMAAVVAVGQALTELELGPQWEAALPLIVWARRSAEGLADQIDPAKRRHPN